MNREDFKKEERLKIDVLEVWNEVQRHIEDERKDLVINKNSRWKTIRIFVSSTFKDFHTEREVLVKEVFPELRDWCQKRDLNLVECDLRWGVPEETPYSVTLQICLEEIRRCEQENKWPFFLNMISKRIGWVPLRDELTAELISDFNLVIGLSVTEMEIVEAAYRKINPNSLFMWRDEGFLKKIKEDKVKQEFLDDLNPLADKKMSMLKQQLRKRFPEEQICTYTSDYVPGLTLPYSGRTRLQLDPIFKDKVLEFFKERIQELYVNEEEKGKDKQNQYELEHDQQDAFMQQRAGNVLGRSDIITKMNEYIHGNSTKPLIFLGESGSGKSTVMAKVIYDIVKAESNSPRENKLVFFHFVGAVPNSTSLLEILKRFIHTMRQLSIPSRSSDVFMKVRSLIQEMQNEHSKRIIIFIDALDQLDSDEFDSCNVIYSWLPQNLPPSVKCIISMIPCSIPHQIFKANTKLYEELSIEILSDLCMQNEIISKYLINYRKKLDTNQTLALLNHVGSRNPLWLITACEELRSYGDFKKLTEYIKTIPSTLDLLLNFVLNRICGDIGDRDLLIATLCLIECSKNGLREVELLEILATMDTSTNYKELVAAKSEFSTKPRLLSWKWGSIYRQLKSFIQPYGDSGEGRLNFYHKSMSKVVRENYLKMEHKKGETWEFRCHQAMAIYFETILDINRKIEEYPYQLIELGDMIRLRTFLQDWEVIEKLFDSEWSKRLLYFWRTIDVNYESLKCDYSVLADKFRKNEKLSKDDLVERIEIIARVFSQSGLLKDAEGLGRECREIMYLLERNRSWSVEVVGKRNESQMYIAGFLGHLETVLNKNYKKAMEFHDEALARIETIPNQHDYRIRGYQALQQIKKAYCLGELANTSSFFKKCEKYKSRELGLDLCMKAISTFKEIKEYNHELEAMLTKATLCHKSEIHKTLEEVMSNCKAYYGVEHDLMARALYNQGIEYELEKNLDKAYNRFKAAYLLSKHLYGPGHNSTLEYLDVFKEPRYEKISKKRNEIVEQIVFDPLHPDMLLSE